MSKRLNILTESLQKKEAAFDAALENHFESVKSSNGQPLNDKRNGAATLNQWERQNNALRNKQTEIEKTKNAIEREESKIANVNSWNDVIPAEILKLVESGELIQWRKHPNTFFVSGVDKARIVWLEDKKLVAHRYVSEVTDAEQRKKFVAIYNGLNAVLNRK